MKLHVSWSTMGKLCQNNLMLFCDKNTASLGEGIKDASPEILMGGEANCLLQQQDLAHPPF